MLAPASMPLRDGVAPSYLRLPPSSCKTVLDFLRQHFAEIEPSIWLARCERGDIRDQEDRIISATTPYQVGLCVFYYREIVDEKAIPFEATILYQDDHLLVADKPHFLPVIPSGKYVKETLLSRLRAQLNMPDLAPLHRLDRETAGLVMFSTNRGTRGLYQTLFERKAIQKIYHAIAANDPSREFPLTVRSRIERDQLFFRSCEVAGVANSETRIEKLMTDGSRTLYELHPLTGKKHQLRLHMASLGLPIENDPWYPVIVEREDDFARPLQLLAKTLSFVDPVKQSIRQFESAKRLV